MFPNSGTHCAAAFFGRMAPPELRSGQHDLRRRHDKRFFCRRHQRRAGGACTELRAGGAPYLVLAVAPLAALHVEVGPSRSGDSTPLFEGWAPRRRFARSSESGQCCLTAFSWLPLPVPIINDHPSPEYPSLFTYSIISRSAAHAPKKTARRFRRAEFESGNDLLSQSLALHYHRRCGVSLPCSGWERVGPPRYGHQRRSSPPFQGSGSSLKTTPIHRTHRARSLTSAYRNQNPNSLFFLVGVNGIKSNGRLVALGSTHCCASTRALSTS